jgi:hypothetical protein
MDLNSVKKGLDTPENRAFLIQHAQFYFEMVMGLEHLIKKGLDTQENCILITKNPRFAWQLSLSIDYLTHAKINTEENYNLLFQHLPSVGDTLIVFGSLHWTGYFMHELILNCSSV